METITINVPGRYTIEEMVVKLQELYPTSNVGWVDHNPPAVGYFYIDNKKVIFIY